MRSLLLLIDTAISIYIWILIAAAIWSWLVNFSVVDTRNRLVFLLGDFLTRVTEPALRPIRRIVPNLGGIDITPILLILLLYLIRNLLFEYA